MARAWVAAVRSSGGRPAAFRFPDGRANHRNDRDLRADGVGSPVDPQARHSRHGRSYFRRRYTNTDLNLRSVDRTNDLRLILIVLAIESAFELSVFGGILRLSRHQVLLGAPLSFAIFFIGRVLPTMVLIYAILLPRYLKLTGSATSTVLLGGLTYAAMHIVEGWSAFDSSRDIALSLLFVLLSYIGPGMFKSVLTLRTGNAWVHALGYHAVAPHVIADTPLVVKVFGIP